MQKTITKEKVFGIIEFIRKYFNDELQFSFDLSATQKDKTITRNQKYMQSLLTLLVLFVLKVENYKLQGNKSTVYIYIAEYFNSERTVVYNLLKRHIIEFKELRMKSFYKFINYYLLQNRKNQLKKSSKETIEFIYCLYVANLDVVIDELYNTPDSKLYYNKLIDTYKKNNAVDLGSIIEYENKKYYISGFIINEKKEVLINIINKKESLLITYKKENNE